MTSKRLVIIIISGSNFRVNESVGFRPRSAWHGELTSREEVTILLRKSEGIKGLPKR